MMMKDEGDKGEGEGAKSKRNKSHFFKFLRGTNEGQEKDEQELANNRCLSAWGYYRIYVLILQGGKK
jgi:hypothetical protein